MIGKWELLYCDIKCFVELTEDVAKKVLCVHYLLYVLYCAAHHSAAVVCIAENLKPLTEDIV